MCEDLPEAIALLRVNSIVDEDESLLICQSEDGVIGSVSKSTQGGAAYVTREGIEDTFCVLILGEPVDDDYGVEEELGDIVDALRKK